MASAGSGIIGSSTGRVLTMPLLLGFGRQEYSIWWTRLSSGMTVRATTSFGGDVEQLSRALAEIAKTDGRRTNAFACAPAVTSRKAGPQLLQLRKILGRTGRGRRQLAARLQVAQNA